MASAMLYRGHQSGTYYMWGECKVKVYEFPNAYYNGIIDVHDAEESLHNYQGIMGLGYQLTQAVDNSGSLQYGCQSD